MKSFKYVSPVRKVKREVCDSIQEDKTDDDANDEDSVYVPSDASTVSTDSSDSECWSVVDDFDDLMEQENPAYLLIECAADAVDPALRSFLRSRGMSTEDIREYFAERDGDDFVGMKLLKMRSAGTETDGGISRAKLKKTCETDWIGTFASSMNRVEKRGGIQQKTAKVFDDKENQPGSSQGLSQKRVNEQQPRAGKESSLQNNVGLTPKKKHRCVVKNCPFSECTSFRSVPQ